MCLPSGLCRVDKEMQEFSLAWKDDNAETFINGEFLVTRVTYVCVALRTYMLSVRQLWMPPGVTWLLVCHKRRYMSSVSYNPI